MSSLDTQMEVEGLIIDPGALRQLYRDRITTLSNNVLYRKSADGSARTESCYICLDGWEIGDEVVRLRCECPHWTHEACLAKSVSQIGRCPTCQASIHLLDDEIGLARAAAQGKNKAPKSRLPTPTTRASATKPRSACSWTSRPRPPLKSKLEAEHARKQEEDEQRLRQEQERQGGLQQPRRAATEEAEATHLAAEEDEVKRRLQQEQERVLRESERRRREEERRKEAAAQRKLRTLGVCVARYRWIKQAGGYRCAGGSHYESDAQLGLG
ncbi:MAG: hypothetical protein L6R40_008641 [Gallowayella cf. fulva]|nr:MAG: hypothetical protein L6R40_008641 [Xanthomendoza cf. fulva]